MSFVVYSIKDEEYFVIPKKWVKNIRFEQIVNGIMNSSILYKCYCGDDDQAYTTIGEKHRRPNLEYLPDFNTTPPFYLAKLKKYFGNN